MRGLNTREKRFLSITLSVWGVFFVISGIVMNSQTKSITQTNYLLNIEHRQIAEAQAKTNEIKLKDIEVEVNTPISTDVKDYLENVSSLSTDTLKSLKLDTSLVNINEPGTYQYTITYHKKNYIGTIIVKEKELPNLTLTLKTIRIKTKEAISSNPRTFINEIISDEVFNNITLDISKVDTSVQGDYIYYIIYKDVIYQGKVEVRDPGPTIITPSTEEDQPKPEENTTEITCPEDAKIVNNSCICNDITKRYDSETKTCK